MMVKTYACFCSAGMAREGSRRTATSRSSDLKQNLKAIFRWDLVCLGKHWVPAATFAEWELQGLLQLYKTSGLT